MKMLSLRLKTNPYRIYLGSGVFDEVGVYLREISSSPSVLIISDTQVFPLYGERLLKNLAMACFRWEVLTFAAGEQSKNMDTVLTLVREMLRLGMDRKTLIIALGGGVVGDVAGFVASIYMRGIPYVQIPTSLIAQVDSSIGGKTGVDLEEGKNLIGTFYQPKAVFIDPSLLDTLPQKEWENGLAEIIKYGVIDERKSLFKLLKRETTNLRRPTGPILERIIYHCCRIKKNVVERDERDLGLRHGLNFGHTLGHALEAVSNYHLSHGRGVAYGMLFALRLSEKLVGLKAQERREVEGLIKAVGLPTVIPPELDGESILEKLRRDKKKEGKTINFVLIKEIGKWVLQGGIEENLIKAVFEELR